MIKFGIMSRKQIRAQAKAFRSSRRLMPFIAFTLLRDFHGDISATDERFLSLLYAAIPGGAYTAKSTSADRYETVEGTLAREIENTFSADQPLRIHDMAASSAVTSLKFFNLLKHRENITLHATDYYDALYVVKVPGRRWETVFDAEGQPLQFVGKRMVIKGSRFKAATRLRSMTRFMYRSSPKCRKTRMCCRSAVSARCPW